MIRASIVALGIPPPFCPIVVGCHTIEYLFLSNHYVVGEISKLRLFYQRVRKGRKRQKQKESPAREQVTFNDSGLETRQPSQYDEALNLVIT
jgi:hypothetical protein